VDGDGWCDECGQRTYTQCAECTLCPGCCSCDPDDFDADELGLDPEEKYDA